MINNILPQLQSVAEAAGGRGERAGPSQAGGFAQELQRSIARVSEAQEAAHAKAQAFEVGEPGVALNDVMIDMQKAGIAFQTAIQVRNRLVTAYQEVASMPV